MKLNRTPLLALALAVLPLVSAAQTTIPADPLPNLGTVVSAIEAQGWTVHESEVEGQTVEIEARQSNGQIMKLEVNRADMKILHQRPKD